MKIITVKTMVGIRQSRLVRSLLCLASFIIILSSCSGPKKVTKAVEITPPSGVEFNTLSNYNVFAKINIPYSGYGFKYADIATSVYSDDANTRTRRSTLEKGDLFISSKNYGKDNCTFDEDIAILERVVLEKDKNEGKYIIEKRSIGNKQVAYFELVKGVGTTTMGYLIENGNKAALIYAKVFLGNDIERKTKINEVFVYMIKTLSFREAIDK